eukprot:TRINITY_DN14969_c0_g1_i2.p1 TRINITY_DN14969_c0_g1~~TRINITY_DN14969_c0_g1_i2.p1  ORF type:complete len:999 (+),score=111.04 TRINITY_DN14969_c0_g1_i2:126-3122(+)
MADVRPQPFAFPATRRILWDRAPRGHARELHAGTPASIAVLPAAVRDLALRLLGGRSLGTEGLAARCGCERGGSAAGQLSVSVERLLPADADSDMELLRLDDDECLVRCFLRYADSGRPLAGGDAHPTPAEVRAALDARDRRTRLARGEGAGTTSAAAVALRPWEALAWAAVVAVDGRERVAHLRLYAILPRRWFSMVLLATPLRNMQTPLLARLQTAGRPCSMGHGFLTMDQGRRAVCLASTDEMVARVPLVGVWVDMAGGQDPARAVAAAWWDATAVLDDPLVWSAAARFVDCPDIAERVWVAERTFLVLVLHYNEGEKGVCCSYFEARYEDDSTETVLVAPAAEAQRFPVHESDGSVSVHHLSVDVLSAGDIIPAGARRSENPEDDIPPDGVLGAEARGQARPRDSYHREQQQSAASRVPASRDVGSTSVESLFVISPHDEPRVAPPRPQPSPERASTDASALRAAVEEARSSHASVTSRTGYSLPSVAHARNALCNSVTSSVSVERPSTSVRLPSDAGISEVRRSAQHRSSGLDAALPDDAASLHRLVGMQQTQLLEMQRQLGDLHQLVAKLASGNCHSGNALKTDLPRASCTDARPEVVCDVASSMQRFDPEKVSFLKPSASAAVGDSLDMQTHTSCRTASVAVGASLDFKPSARFRDADTMVGASIDTSFLRKTCDVSVGVGESLDLSSHLERLSLAVKRTSCDAATDTMPATADDRSTALVRMSDDENDARLSVLPSSPAQANSRDLKSPQTNQVEQSAATDLASSALDTGSGVPHHAEAYAFRDHGVIDSGADRCHLPSTEADAAAACVAPDIEVPSSPVKPSLNKSRSCAEAKETGSHSVCESLASSSGDSDGPLVVLGGPWASVPSRVTDFGIARDSADTAGGASPRGRMTAGNPGLGAGSLNSLCSVGMTGFGASGSSSQRANTIGLNFGLLHTADVPRIVWPVDSETPDSPRSEASYSPDVDASALSSLELPELQLRLGLGLHGVA